MNERILELLVQSGLLINVSDHRVGELDPNIKKFAELLIRECLEQVRDEVQYEYDWKLADAVSKRVMEHFGVR